MSDAVFTNSDAGVVHTPLSKIRKPKIDLPSIVIDGQTWDARKKLAADIGVCDTTLARKNYPTMRVGGVSYLCRENTLREMANEARRRNEAPIEAVPPPVRRRHHQR
jgi:hypothetical protein